MTKLEALAKDCIENHIHRLIDRPSKQDIYTREESIYISGYKECERQNKNKIAELERKLEQTEKDLTDYQFNYPKIKDLEKENAELKKQVKQNRHLADVRLEQSLENYKLFSDERKERIDTDIALEDMTDNLTKAKEILQLFLKLKTIPCASGNSVNMLQFENICKQAEQFLKDSEVEK